MQVMASPIGALAPQLVACVARKDPCWRVERIVEVPSFGCTILYGFFEDAAVGRNNSSNLQIANVKEQHAKDDVR
jgi:hypothetical protein